MRLDIVGQTKYIIKVNFFYFGMWLLEHSELHMWLKYFFWTCCLKEN